jgi:hypothetical protein
VSERPLATAHPAQDLLGRLLGEWVSADHAVILTSQLV